MARAAIRYSVMQTLLASEILPPEQTRVLDREAQQARLSQRVPS